VSQWFAWHGFSLSFPEDWLPVVLTGNYARGYVRWEGERGHTIQIRWQKAEKGVDLRRGVETYLNALHQTARRRRLPCQTLCEEERAGGVEYSWKAEVHAYGRRWFDPTTSRIFSLERWAPSRTSLKREVRRLCEEMVTYGGPVQPWSLLGLRVRLPVSYRLKSWKLLSGYTELVFQAGLGGSVCASRWSFAQEILRRHSLVAWAQGVTGCSTVQEERDEAVLLKGNSPWLRLLGREATALVRYDKEHNQIHLLKAFHKRNDTPDWSWLLG
jgi:hypothetical protein